MGTPKPLRSQSLELDVEMVNNEPLLLPKAMRKKTFVLIVNAEDRLMYLMLKDLKFTYAAQFKREFVSLFKVKMHLATSLGYKFEHDETIGVWWYDLEKTLVGLNTVLINEAEAIVESRQGQGVNMPHLNGMEDVYKYFSCDLIVKAYRALEQVNTGLNELHTTYVDLLRKAADQEALRHRAVERKKKFGIHVGTASVKIMLSPPPLPPPAGSSRAGSSSQPLTPPRKAARVGSV